MRFVGEPLLLLSDGFVMTKISKSFETTDVSRLSSIVTDCAKACEARGISVDDAMKEEITKFVLQVAARGIRDPSEICELVTNWIASGQSPRPSS
jgi:hypothetical protein